MDEILNISGSCEEGCQLFQSCDTRRIRKEREEYQLLCPLAESFYNKNPSFPTTENVGLYSSKIQEFIREFVATKLYITARHFALLLPNLDDQLQKSDILLNIAYFMERFTPSETDETIFSALEKGLTVTKTVRFYRHALENGSKKANMRMCAVLGRALKAYAEDIEKIQSLSQSRNSQDHLDIINIAEQLITKYTGLVDRSEVNGFLLKIIDSSCKKLRKYGNDADKSGNDVQAYKYFQGACRGFHILTIIKPEEPSNYAEMIYILYEKTNRWYVEHKLDDNIKMIKNYSDIAIRLLDDPNTKLKYRDPFYPYLKIGSMFRILGDICENRLMNGNYKEHYRYGVKYINMAFDNYVKSEDPVATMRLLQSGAMDMGICLRKLGEHHEAIVGYDKLLEEYDNWYQGHMAKGDALKELKMYEDAETSYKKCINLRPGDVAAYDKLMILYDVTGRSKEAIRVCANILNLPVCKSNNDSLNYMFFKYGSLWERAGYNIIAANIFSYIISKRQPNSHIAHNKLIYIYMRLFDWDSAEISIERKIQVQGNDKLYFDYCRLGDCRRNKGDYAGCFNAYQEAFAIRPNSLIVLQRLASLAELRKDYRGAIKYINIIISIIGDNISSSSDYMWRGDLHLKCGDRDKAVYDYNKAIELNPSSDKLKERLDILEYSGSPSSRLKTKIEMLMSILRSIPLEDSAYNKTALVILNKIIQSRDNSYQGYALEIVGQLFPHDTIEYLTYKASVLLKLGGDIEGAITCRARLIQNVALPNDILLNNICILLKLNLDIGRYVEAEELVSKLEIIASLDILYNIEPDIIRNSRETYEYIVSYLLKRKLYIKARQYADLLLDIVQDTDKIYLTYKGRALIGEKKYDEAELIFRKLLELYDNDSYAHYYIGEIHILRDEIQDAIKSYTLAYEHSKKNGDKKGIIVALNRLVKTYSDIGEEKCAINAASELLSLDPNDTRIMTYRAVSYFKIGSINESLSDFVSIFRNSPEDWYAAKVLLNTIGLEKGIKNNYEIINKIVLDIDNNINDPKCIINIINVLCEQDVYCEYMECIVKEIFLRYPNNGYIISSLAHYLMKFTIYTYIYQREDIDSVLKKILSLLLIETKHRNPFVPLREYWGSERQSYLNYFYDIFIDEFKRLDKILSEIDYNNLDVSKINEYEEEYRTLCNKTDNLLEIYSNDQQINVEYYFNELDNYMQETFIAFLRSSVDCTYWNKLSDIIEKIPINDICFSDNACRYTFRQLSTMAILAIEKDFKSVKSEYHSIKNWLSGIIIELNENNKDIDIKGIEAEINTRKYHSRNLLSACRSPILKNVTMSDIVVNITNKLLMFGIKVNIIQQLDKNYNSDNDVVCIDYERIIDCIDNLIINSHNAVRKNISHDTPESEEDIILYLIKEPKKFIIITEDRGIGMDNNMKSVFERGEGGGIGTRCIKKAVDVHRGSMRVDWSEPGKGTRIRIEIGQPE